jgi:hypothetical protein
MQYVQRKLHRSVTEMRRSRWTRPKPSTSGAVSVSTAVVPAVVATVAGRYSPRSSSGSEDPRRNGPDRPPVFSQRATSPMVIERSADLHMS